MRSVSLALSLSHSFAHTKLTNLRGEKVQARGSCDAIFDKYVLCLMNSDCFKSKGPSAGNAELKQCARRNAPGVPEECATLHEAVKVCNRSQVWSLRISTSCPSTLLDMLDRKLTMYALSLSLSLSLSRARCPGGHAETLQGQADSSRRAEQMNTRAVAIAF